VLAYLNFEGRPPTDNDRSHMCLLVAVSGLRLRGMGVAAFVAAASAYGDVWTCKKGIGEDLENVGSTVAIMRIIDLLPG
jgi:hypothetical protein